MVAQLAVNQWVVGSNPTSGAILIFIYGDVAHLVERSIRIAEVVGSSPIVSTKIYL